MKSYKELLNQIAAESSILRQLTEDESVQLKHTLIQMYKDDKFVYIEWLFYANLLILFLLSAKINKLLPGTRLHLLINSCLNSSI